MFVFGLFLGASVLRDLMGEAEPSPDGEGYGWGFNSNVSRPGIGMRGPTSSFRYPLPRPWERLPSFDTVPARPHSRFGEEGFGMMGSGGIRGVSSNGGFTAAQIAAYNRDGAAQGLRGGSVSPLG